MDVKKYKYLKFFNPSLKDEECIRLVKTFATLGKNLWSPHKVYMFSSSIKF